jgi:hypothetical protein
MAGTGLMSTAFVMGPKCPAEQSAIRTSLGDGAGPPVQLCAGSV